MNQFGSNLRKLRESRGKHLRELAAVLGKSVPYICDIELGRRKPQRDFLPAIAEFLSTDISELETWIALDNNIVEIDISGKGLVSELALLFLQRSRNLSDSDAKAIINILRGGKNHGEEKLCPA